jgi:hypothetical protein
VDKETSFVQELGSEGALEVCRDCHTGGAEISISKCEEGERDNANELASGEISSFPTKFRQDVIKWQSDRQEGEEHASGY